MASQQKPLSEWCGYEAPFTPFRRGRWPFVAALGCSRKQLPSLEVAVKGGGGIAATLSPVLRTFVSLNTTPHTPVCHWVRPFVCPAQYWSHFLAAALQGFRGKFQRESHAYKIFFVHTRVETQAGQNFHHMLAGISYGTHWCRCSRGH